VHRIDKFLDGSFVKWTVVAFYAYFLLIILSEVIGRYFFSHSTTWGEMTARYAFVYFSYIAAAEAFRHDEHIRIDFVPKRLSPRLRSYLESYIDLWCVVISVLVIWHSIDLILIQRMADIRMHALPLNLAWAVAALPIGWGLMLIRIAQRWYRRRAQRSENVTSISFETVESL